MPLPPNAWSGCYEIRSQIGAGGMGEVYLADDTRVHRKAVTLISLKIRRRIAGECERVAGPR